MQKDTEVVHGEVEDPFPHKEDQSDVREERRLKDLVKKHSGFTGFPIELYVENSKENEATDSEEDEGKRKTREAKRAMNRRSRKSTKTRRKKTKKATEVSQE